MYREAKMSSSRKILLVAAIVSALAGMAATPLSQGAETSPNPKLIERGRYVVKLGGCNDCHTQGYAESAGKAPEQTWLTGSPLGYRGPWGTTYATNLRPRFQSMTADQWVRFARNVQTRPPMPWFVLHEMSEADLRAMHAFVASLGPAAGTSPNYLPAGQEPAPPYVTFPTPPPR